MARVPVKSDFNELFKAVDRQINQVLDVVGAKVANRMSDAMPRKNSPSGAGATPGGYPRWYYGGLKKSHPYGIKHERLAGRNAVVVGPRTFNRAPTPRRAGKKSSLYTQPLNKTVPQLLNEGGLARMFVQYHERTEVRIVRYNSFPFVNLTLPYARQELLRTMRVINLGF
jgi:hypothetical protein